MLEALEHHFLDLLDRLLRHAARHRGHTSSRHCSCARPGGSNSPNQIGLVCFCKVKIENDSNFKKRGERAEGEGLHLVGMAGNGQGSIDTQLERYIDAGVHQAKAKLLLDSTIHSLKKLMAKAGRTPLATVKNELEEVVETLSLVSKVMSVSGKTWQTTVGCYAAVQGQLSAELDNGLDTTGVAASLQTYVAGPNESSRASPMQDVSGGIEQRAQADAPYMNTRPGLVEGWTLERPTGQSFLQMSDALAKMIEVRNAPEKKMRRAGHAIWQYWHDKKWFGASYSVLCQKVRQVLAESKSSRSQGLSLDEIIQKHCSRDRTAVDKPARSGRPPFLTPVEFKKRVGAQTHRKKSAGKNVVMATLSDAKKAYHAARGLHARSGEVNPGTYARYMQFTGGDE